MSFKSFITEQENSNMAKIIIQKIIDNVDNVHVFQTNNSMKFNIGDTVASLQLSNLDLVMVEDPTTFVKLGKSKSKPGKFAIVIKTPELPDRKNVDGFLSTNSDVYNGVLNEITRYIHSKKFVVAPNPTEDNDIMGFEEIYNKTISNVNDNIEQFEKAIESMKSELESTHNMGKTATIKSAIKRLTKDTIGENCDDFVSSVMKNNKELTSKLKKEEKDKFEKRLKSYYKSKVEPML